MSEELLQEENKPEETMADYEEHFDDANPWNVVQRYMENKTTLPVKVEGIVNGGAIVDHDAVLGRGAHVAPGGIVKAGAEVAPLAKVDSGEVIRSPWEQA